MDSCSCLSLQIFYLPVAMWHPRHDEQGLASMVNKKVKSDSRIIAPRLPASGAVEASGRCYPWPTLRHAFGRFGWRCFQCSQGRWAPIDVSLRNSSEVGLALWRLGHATLLEHVNSLIFLIPSHSELHANIIGA